MPADLTMPERTERHGDAATPYRRHQDDNPPGAAKWAREQRGGES